MIAATTPEARARLDRLLAANAIFLALIAVWLVGAAVSEAFLMPNYLFNVVRQIAPVGIAAIGVTYVMILGGVDLSIGELAVLIRDLVHPEADLVFDLSKPDGMPRRVLDVTSLTELGWGASIDLADGLATTYDWFREHEGTARTAPTATATGATEATDTTIDVTGSPTPTPTGAR